LCSSRPARQAAPSATLESEIVTSKNANRLREWLCPR
jgi:hypothetical protein